MFRKHIQAFIAHQYLFPTVRIGLGAKGVRCVAIVTNQLYPLLFPDIIILPNPGARIGCLLALERIKNSFNSYPLDRLANVGAAAAFEDREYFDKTCGLVIENREKVAAQLEAKGFEVLPSAANFIRSTMRRRPLKHRCSLWERACSRIRFFIQQIGWLIDRFREQARSHSGFYVVAVTALLSLWPVPVAGASRSLR